MKNQIKYIALLLGIGLAIGFIASAAPTIIFQPDVFPISNDVYKLGSSTREWLSISVKNASTTITSATTLCLSGDACRTTWPTGGGTTITQLGQIEDVSTSTLSFGHLLMWDGSAWQDTATSALGLGGSSGTVSSVDMSVPTGLTISGNPITTTGTLALTLTSGYNIPLNASTTNWNTFFAIPSTRVTDGTGLTWSSNTLDCDTASGSVQGCLAAADWTTFDGKQAGDSDLTALAALSGTGLVARTGSATYSERTIATSTDHIIVVNPDGVSGNPTLKLRPDSLR